MRAPIAIPTAIAALTLLAASAASQTATSDGERLFGEGRYAEARGVLEAAARANPEDAQTTQLAGRIALHQTRFDDAVRWLERAAALEPSRADHLVWLARAYGQLAIRGGLRRKWSLSRKIRGTLERAVALDSTSVDARASLIQYYLLAPGIAGGSRKKAEQQLAELARLSAYRGQLARAWIAEDREDYELAAREYRAAIAAAPDSLEAQHALGRMYQRSAQYDSAFALFDRLLQARPHEMPAYYQYGRTASLAGQNLERGAEVIRKYLAWQPREGDPPLSSAHYRLGLIYERQGDRGRARQEFEASLRLEPTRDEVRKALDRVR